MFAYNSSATSAQNLPPSFVIRVGDRPVDAFIKPRPCRKTAWQHGVCQSDLPCATKGVLLQISVEWMNAEGGSCFPSQQQIMERLGISRPALTRHIRLAVEGGYLEVWHFGHGVKNRRYNYHARLPGDPDGKESFLSPGGEGKDSCPSITIANVNHSQEGASAAATVAMAQTVEALSVESLRKGGRTPMAEDWALPDNFIQIAKELRPDLLDSLDTVAGNFRDFHLSRGTKSACWAGEWRIWIRRERTPKASAVAAHKAAVGDSEPSRYDSWQSGAPAPVGIQESAEQVAERFAAQCRRLGMVQQPDGSWLRPGAAPVVIGPKAAPRPLPRPVIQNPPLVEVSAPAGDEPVAPAIQTPAAAGPALSIAQIAAAVQQAMNDGADMAEARALEQDLLAQRRRQLEAESTRLAPDPAGDRIRQAQAEALADPARPRPTAAILASLRAGGAG